MTVLLALLASSLHLSADEMDPPRVTVFGTATTQVVPDKMDWSLEIKNTGAEVEEVAKVNADSVKEALAFLKGQGLGDDVIQTSGMQFGENWVYRNRDRVKEGYYASTTLSFEVADLEKYQALWMGVPKLPNVLLNGVSLDSTKRIEHRNATRQRALLAAREKAQALAATLGAGIGKPLLIEEINENPASLFSNGNLISNDIGAAGDPGAGETFAPGRIPITMRVRVSFQLK